MEERDTKYLVLRMEIMQEIFWLNLLLYIDYLMYSLQFTNTM